MLTHEAEGLSSLFLNKGKELLHMFHWAAFPFPLIHENALWTTEVAPAKSGL